MVQNVRENTCSCRKAIDNLDKLWKSCSYFDRLRSDWSLSYLWSGFGSSTSERRSDLKGKNVVEVMEIFDPLISYKDEHA